MKTLSVNYYFYILERIESLGFDRETASHIIPFEMQQNRSPTVRIEIDALLELFKLAQEALAIPHIGVNVSKSFRISNYGYAGSIFSTCETISDAINFSEKYGCLAHTLGRFKRDPNSMSEGDWVRYIWTPYFDDGDTEKYRQITECIVSNYALTIKWLSWSIDGNVDKISFRHSAKPPLSEHKQILGCDVEFEAEHNAFWVNRTFLHEKIPTANPLKRSLLTQKLDRLLAIYNQEDDFLDSLKVALKEMMQTERPSLTRAAANLSLTERSLKRQLNKRGVRFQDVVRDIKMELCDIYLKQDIPYSEIAQLLWYADQSAFTRAYKKWHGVSPSQHLQ